MPLRNPLSLFLALPALALHAGRGLPLDSAIHVGHVAAAVYAQGGPGVDGVRVELKNRTDRPLDLVIPAGWVFQSVDEQVQDLLLAKHVPVVIPARGERHVVLETFCTQGRLRAPEVGERYRVGGPGTPALVALARAVDRGRYDRALIQSAVWCVANGYSIAGMGALDGSPADTLRLLASELSGQAPPRYTVRFAEEGVSVCSGRLEAVLRTVEINAPAGALLSAMVHDPAGHVIQVIERDQPLPPGTHQRTYEVQVTDWPPGRYALRVWTTAGAWVQQLPFHL